MEGEPEKSVGTDAYALSHIQLNLFPREAVERLSVPRNALGLTPGSGKDRTVVYVFYNRVESLSQIEARARMDSAIVFYASEGKILGNVIAHELGHVLLNLEVHTATGIMRGAWDRRDLREVALGSLCFSLQQAEVIRAETQRRNSARDTLEVETSAEFVS